MLIYIYNILSYTVMGETEASTTPEEIRDKQLITITIPENTSTSLDNADKQENIFSSVQNKAGNDIQHNKDQNKDEYYMQNEVSGTKMLKFKVFRSVLSSEGYSGLVNQGATCYLNAVLQPLFMTEEFRKAIMKLNESEMKSVSFELKKLFSCLESKNGCATTNEVTNALGIGNVCEQQDAAECYQMILSMIEPEPAKVFQGNKKNVTTCLHANHDPIEETISFFSLPIAMDSDQNKIDVQKSFEAQFEVMLMDGEDQLYCENCKEMMDMEMCCTISELPEVLTLHLQRFYLDYIYMTYMKNTCRVKIPLQLSAQEESDVLHDYELYAVVNHVGSLSGGHYYADIKSYEDEQWYRFNDSMVKSIHPNYKKRHFISGEALMLFFRKSSKQHRHKVNVQQERSVPRSVESESLQTKRNSSPEDSVNLPQRDIDHICTGTENNHESTVISEEDIEAPLNTSDSSTEKESNPPQTMTPDAEMQFVDADHDDQSIPDISSSAEVNIPSAKPEIMPDNSLPQTTVGKTPDTTLIMVQQPGEDNHPSPADIQDSEITGTTFSKVSQSTYTRPEQHTQRCSECKRPQTKIIIHIWMEPKENLPQQDTDHISTVTENAADADYDDQPTPNLHFHGDHVIFSTERQQMDPEPHVTSHNESDSDNDDPEAQCNSLLEQTNVKRRNIPPWVFLFGFILGLILFLVLILSFYL
ncbi:ubiquitin carboxyl-terminal hydrolase 20-like [Sinocyclocheilus anshuiensis]|uniref:ubiquitin carboxyl-terminal hydrolase 20-like n=1 Tax=Sinocyclocheilus anshuiensis TaxID=1608454 RepID=UPI0007B993BF|nr:PREDICTED: ubiquitin carboxyl-terminal hydrolase 20-like [Sinocyclocheilus anshuiensis]